jgi:plasmid maintenance system antidote protein VapI
MTHPLATWLARKGMKPTHFAREVGVQPSFVSMMIAGERGASLKMAVKMSKATGGDLKPADFLQLEAVR